MMVSIVPAEITSVEDKVFGNFNIKQVVLMVFSLLLCFITYLSIPPFNKLSLLKAILGSFILTSFIAMSIRIKERIVIEIILIRLNFFLRPKIYISSLNKIVLIHKKQRLVKMAAKKESIKPAVQKPYIPKKNEKLNFSFNRKGEINVYISKIK